VQAFPPRVLQYHLAKSAIGLQPLMKPTAFIAKRGGPTVSLRVQYAQLFVIFNSVSEMRAV
jgi:hypothetical protein